MLLADIETHLNANGPYSDGTVTYAVRPARMPESPDAVISFTEGWGGKEIRAMGASKAAPIREQRHLIVRVRGVKSDASSAITVAEAVNNQLAGFSGTISGRLYYITVMTHPMRVETDRNDRDHLEAHYWVQKERG